MERYFSPFRENIIGINQTFQTPYGIKNLVYADWIASGRLYRPIEDKISNGFGPFIANTHTESSYSGKYMTDAYHYALNKIKRHVNAGPKDVIITAGFGMTAVVNKFQRILGLKTRDMQFSNPNDRPVVFVTHMEHHSNQTSWYETVAEVVVVEPDEDLLVSPESLERALKPYTNRRIKIGSFSACSNVSGVKTPYHKLAAIMHKAGGYCFVDFAASAPYVDMDMHPENEGEHLDAIFFSPINFWEGLVARGCWFLTRIYTTTGFPIILVGVRLIGQTLGANTSLLTTLSVARMVERLVLSKQLEHRWP